MSLSKSLQRIGEVFGMIPLKPFRDRAPQDRIQPFLRKADSTSRPLLEQALHLASRENSESAISKMSKIKSFAKLREAQPLLWVNTVLAIYDQGHPTLDEVMLAHVRDAMKSAKEQLAKQNPMMHELFYTVKEDVKKRDLTSLEFLEDEASKPPAMAAANQNDAEAEKKIAA